MIRRRSCLTNIIFEPMEFKLFNKLQRRKIFRRSVKFKKYRFKGTKFKRRHIRKLKHNATWALHYNFIRYWTYDTRIIRQYARYQYHYRFFVNNSLITYRTTWAARRNRFFLTQNEWIGASISYHLFLTFGFNTKNTLKFQQNGHHSMAFYLEDSMLGDASTFPFLSLFDNQLFPYNKEEDLENLDIFLEKSILELLTLSNIVEIYKILTILWYWRIINLNNHVYKILYV